MKWVKKTALMLIISLSLILAGCWDRIELNERGLVLGAALDKAPVADKVMLTAEIANPAQLAKSQSGGGGGDVAPSWVLTSTGWTVFEAVRNLTEQTINKPFWAHNQVFIIGEELAREGVLPYLDVFIRDPEPSANAWFIIAKDATGMEILSVKHVEGAVTGRIIADMVRASRNNSHAVQIELDDFEQQLFLEHQGSVAGRIELIDRGEPENIGLQQSLTEGDLLRYSGAAMFKGDKLVGWLDRKQTRGVNWVTGKMFGGIIVVAAPETNKPKIAIEIKESKSKISTYFVEGMPVVKVEVKVDGNLGEQMGERDVSRERGLLDQLEARTAQVIRNEIEAALAIAQEHQADIFSFGSVINRQHHQKWQEIKEKWADELFPELVVEIDVEANIRRTMGLNRTIKSPGY